MRMQSYGAMTDAQVATLKELMRQGYLRLVSEVQTLDSVAQDLLRPQVKDLGEALDSWLNTNPNASNNLDLWVAEGNRINSVAETIMLQITQPAGGGASVAIALVVAGALGLAWYASR